MDNYQELWQQCLKIIAGKVSPHTFDVWFKDITLESYDPETHTVLISVPHRYVYEYLEEIHAPLLKQAIVDTFGSGTLLNYRIAKSNDNHNENEKITFPAVGQIPQFSIANARERLEKGLHHYLGDKAQWLPAYDQVVEWLTDNKGRGLLCIGTSGLGKTLGCEKILPIILGSNIKTVTADSLYDHIDELLKERCVIVDDLGKEPLKRYGQPDTSFFKLCDAAERRGILLIITTNLSTNRVRNNPLYTSSIEERYGRDVISRLRATVKVVEFKGKDMR
jgi:DNA replication protein DnaC